MSLNGIILVNKPQGVGPFDCTYKVREVLKTKQVSHIEALEPRVEGVLPIFTGKATKLLRLFKGGIREYLCEVTLGYSTVTEDITGEIVDQKIIKRKPSVRQVEKVLTGMVGPHSQIAPMYSAALFEGKKLHLYEQEGIKIPAEKRPIREIEVLDIGLQTEIVRTEADLVTFSCYVKCTDGTFIRSLAAEIGEKLGYPAHMSYLKRLSVDSFNLSDAADYETLSMRLSLLVASGKSNFSLRDKKQTWFIPFSDALAPYERITVDEKMVQLAKKGRRIPCEQATFERKDAEPFIILSATGEMLAVYALEGNLGRYHALSVLVET